MATSTALVQQLYVAYFNRPADVDGLAYYVGLLDGAADADAVLAAIGADFAASTEYTATYGSLGAKAAVNLIYHNLFGHQADLPGLNYWAALYAAGTVGLDQIVTAIAAGAQGADASAYASKVGAATSFTAAIALSADQQIAYATDAAALAVGVSFLNSVTDAASLSAALADLDSAAAAVVPTVQHLLSAGVDALSGGNANDVFNAYAIDPTTLAATTLNANDRIDGGAGTDTLNVYVSATGNTGALSATLNSIEIVNIINDAGASAAAVDASALGAAVTQIWQVGQAGALSNLAASTTAGFKNITGDLAVSAAAAAASVTIALKNQLEFTTVAIDGAKLASVHLSGSLDDPDADGAMVTLDVSAGANIGSFTLTTAVDAFLVLTETYTTRHITTVDMSASTGAVMYGGTADVKTISSGSGNDYLGLLTATTAAIGALIDTNAGDDTVLVYTTGTGATTVHTGSGDDTVLISSIGEGKLSVDLGAGDDLFYAATEIYGTDAIDGGDGVDTLFVELVGSANIGAFSNFDLFDVASLDHALDATILAARNAVSEFVASGAIVNGAELDNLGAGVGLRFTGDAGAIAIKLAQASAGALTITSDADETEQADAGTVEGAVDALNATALKVVFDTDFIGAAATAGADNIATLDVRAAAATTLAIVSGGSGAANVLDYIDTAATTARLTAITISGDAHLDLSVASAGVNMLAAITDTGTGGLSLSTASVAAGAQITLGAGADAITVTGLSSAAGVVSLLGFEQASAKAVDAAAAAGDVAEAVAAADQLIFTAATGVAGNATAGGYRIVDGVLSFSGAGPATLADAVAAVAAAVAANQVVLFQFAGSSYVLIDDQGNASDTVIKLTGVTGVTDLAADSAQAHHFFIV